MGVPPKTQGVALFAAQLEAMGFAVTVTRTWAEFTFVVPGGTHDGVSVEMALNVPANFPDVPPSGINYTPRLPGRPVNTNAQHPARSHPHQKPGVGNAGEYWSRPHPSWAQEQEKTARTYMAFVNDLWVTT